MAAATVVPGAVRGDDFEEEYEAYLRPTLSAEQLAHASSGTTWTDALVASVAEANAGGGFTDRMSVVWGQYAKHGAL